MATQGHWIARANDFLLIPPKLLYVTMSMVFYSFYLFRPRFYKLYLGFDEREFGDIAAVMALVTFVSMTLWGSVADVMGRHRLILALSTIGMAGSFMLFVFRWNNHLTTVIISFIIGCLYSFFQSGMIPLTDYQALKMLSQRSEFSRDLYGRQRLWGTITYGVTTFAVSALIDARGVSVLFICVPVSAVLFVLTLYIFAVPDSPKPLRQVFSRRPASDSQKQLILGEKADAQKQLILGEKADAQGAHQPEPLAIGEEKMPIDPDAKHIDLDAKLDEAAAAAAAEPMPLKGRWKQLMSNPHYLFLLLVVFLTGSARAVMTTFLAYYVQAEMGFTTTQVGVMAVAGILFEVIIFFFGPWFIQNIGVYWMLIVSQVAMVVRCWAYVALPASPNKLYQVLAIELLKGVAFGLTQNAGVKLSNDVAPKGLEATAQAIYTSMYSQLPGVIAAFVGGRTYKTFGPYTLFLATAIMSTVALVMFVIKYTLDGSIKLCMCRGAERRQGPAAQP